MNNVGPMVPALLPSIVTLGSPPLVFNPASVIPDRIMGGRRDVSAMVLPASEDAKVILCGPGTLLAAMIASRSEMPSAPGLFLSVVGFAVLPLTVSLLFDTTILAAGAGVMKPASAAANASACSP